MMRNITWLELATARARGFLWFRAKRLSIRTQILLLRTEFLCYKIILALVAKREE